MFLLLLTGLTAALPGEAADPEDPRGAELFLSALKKERTGNLQYASDLYRDLDREKVSISPYAALRRAELMTRQPGLEADAEKILRRYADAHGDPEPWTRPARMKLAGLLARTGRRAEAKRYWAEAFADLPALPWFVEDEEWKRIENLLAAPDTAMAALPFLRPRAESLFIQKRKQAAKALLELPDPRVRALGARAMMRSGMMDETRELFDRESVRLDTGGLGPLDWRGLQQILTATDQPTAEARKLLAGVLRTSREHPWLEAWLTYCARSAAGRKAWDTARMFMDALMEVSPPDDTNTAEALYWLAGRLKEAGEKVKAEAVYKQLIAQYPRHPRVFWCWMTLGELAADAGQWTEAADRYARAAEVTPRVDYRARARWRQAEILGRLNRPPLQREALRMASACAPGPYEAHRALARLMDPEAHPLPGTSAGFMAYSRLPHLIDPELHPRTETEKRVWFFARHGLPEGEWESLHLLLHPPAGADRRSLLRFLCNAGYMHTVVNLTAGERAGQADRDDTLLCLDYPVAYWPLVSRIARMYDLDPFLILAVARQESTFRPSLISRAGAVGVMQVMPATARWMVSKDPELPRDAASRLLEPEHSIRLGAAYLRWMLNQFDGNLIYALAAYNGGPGNCTKWIRAYGHRPPEAFIEAIPFEETRDYVKKVLGNLAAYHTLWTLP